MSGHSAASLAWRGLGRCVAPLAKRQGRMAVKLALLWTLSTAGMLGWVMSGGAVGELSESMEAGQAVVVPAESLRSPPPAVAPLLAIQGSVEGSGWGGSFSWGWLRVESWERLRKERESSGWAALSAQEFEEWKALRRAIANGGAASMWEEWQSREWLRQAPQFERLRMGVLGGRALMGYRTGPDGVEIAVDEGRLPSRQAKGAAIKFAKRALAKDVWLVANPVALLGIILIWLAFQLVAVAGAVAIALGAMGPARAARRLREGGEWLVQEGASAVAAGLPAKERMELDQSLPSGSEGRRSRRL